MSTPASPLSVQDFASRIRAKFPGSYDNLPDDELAQRVVAKHPEYKGKVALGAAQAAPAGGQAPSAVSGLSDRLAQLRSQTDELLTNPISRFFSSLKETSPIPLTTDPNQLREFGGNLIRRIAAHPEAGPIGMLAPTPQETQESIMAVAPKVGQEAKATYQAAKGGDVLGTLGHGAGTLGYSAATATAPFGGGMMAKAGEQFGGGDVAGGLGTTTGIIGQLLAMKAAPEATEATKAVFQREMAATAHDILNKSSTQIKGKLWDAHNAVSDRVGKLVNDISAADYAKGEASIPVADLWEKVKDTADQYKAGGKDTPKFNAAQAAVLDRGPYLTWKELHDLKQEVGSQWYKAAEGSRDSGAVNALLDDINKKLAQRATEVDRGEQFKAYNSLWSTLKNYESDGVMGKLQNAPNGKAFMDTLKDPANKADLTRTVNSLSQFGFPKDTLSDFSDTHGALHKYVTDTQKKGFGKIRIVTQHPVTGTAGVVAGMGAGSLVGHPMLGGIAGGLAATSLADRVAAARAIARLGRPSLTGEMEEAALVKPVGSGERPTPPASTGTINRNELIQAMQSLGYSKQEAATRAMQGIAEHPNDFSAALNRAMRGAASAEKAATIKSVKPVSGGSPAAERGTYAADPRTHEQILEGLRALKESQAKNATIESRAEPMGAKSIRQHNLAFDEAKRQWQAENPGKDPINHMSEIARRAENLRKGK